MRVGWGKPYNALYQGCVTELHVRDGDEVRQGAVIAYTMRTDDRGRPAYNGKGAPINTPFKGVVRLYIEQGSRFDQGELLFHLEYADADHSKTESLPDYLQQAEKILMNPDMLSMTYGIERTPRPLRQMFDSELSDEAMGALTSLLHSPNGVYRRIAAFAFGQLGYDSAPIIEMLESRKVDDPAPDVLFALGASIATLRLRPRRTGAKDMDRRRKIAELCAMYG